MRKHKYLWIKLMLVFIAEMVAMTITYSISAFIHPVEHPVTLHVLMGATLAVLVVTLYNWRLKKKKERLEKELKDLTDVVLKKIPDNKQ